LIFISVTDRVDRRDPHGVSKTGQVLSLQAKCCSDLCGQRQSIVVLGDSMASER
jgi:hypothetical protein